MNILQRKALATVGAKIAIRYRWEAIAAMLATPVSLIIYYFLWQSIFSYTGTEVLRGFTFPAMVQYYVIIMIVGFFTWSELDAWLEFDILRGNIIMIMLRPVGLINFYLTFESGINIYNIITQMIPIFIIGYVFFGLQLAPLMVFLAFILSLLFAFLIYSGIAFLVGLVAFWTKKITGIRRVRRIIIGFLGGSFIPIAFFPDWLQVASTYLPFQYTRSVPAMLYLGKAPILESLLLQFVWVVIIYTLIHIISKKAVKRCANVGI